MFMKAYFSLASCAVSFQDVSDHGFLLFSVPSCFQQFMSSDSWYFFLWYSFCHPFNLNTSCPNNNSMQKYPWFSMTLLILLTSIKYVLCFSQTNWLSEVDLQGPYCFNELPRAIRSLASIVIFKSKLREHF